MVARYAGAGLGLLAFTVTVVAGLAVHNPVTVTLSRSILALFVFCLIGLVLGTAAQMVVAEHGKRRESEITERYSEGPPAAQDEPETSSTDEDNAPIGA
jgi:hypothetical protein